MYNVYIVFFSFYIYTSNSCFLFVSSPSRVPVPCFLPGGWLVASLGGFWLLFETEVHAVGKTSFFMMLRCILFLVSLYTVDSLRLTPLPRRDFGNVLSSAVAVGLAKRASAEGVDEKTVAQRLSTVPVFAVTTADGDTPYFTETEYATKASQAVFYIERSDALPALAKVQKSADKDAIISSVPLSSAWALVGARDKKSQEENGGVFKFEASRRQIVHANGNSGRDLGLEKNNLVPLFFDRRVTVTSEGAFPLFFKLEDLEKVYAKGLKSVPTDIVADVQKPNIEVTTLDRAMSSMRDGSLDKAADVIFLSSESFS